MNRELYEMFCNDKFFFDQALQHFTEEKSHLKQANAYARENPEAKGFITFPMSRTGGWHFYWIINGKAKKTGADSCWLLLRNITA